MGVRRLFSMGGQKNSRRQEPTFCLKNNRKEPIFSEKSKNLFLAGLGRPGGQEHPCHPPLDAHAYIAPIKLDYFIIPDKMKLRQRDISRCDNNRLV